MISFGKLVLLVWMRMQACNTNDEENSHINLKEYLGFYFFQALIFAICLNLILQTIHNLNLKINA